jgi:RND superfamily putative drug exporter
VTKRPRLAIAAWLLAVVLLGAKGAGIDGELSLHPVFVDGTASKRAHEIADREFGGNFTMIVMLRGPQSAVGRQGRLLATRLGAIPRVQVISPWARGATIKGLHPKPGVAALVVRLEADDGDEGLSLAKPVQRQVQETVKGRVHASIAGLPAVIDSFRAAIEHAAQVGLLISVPVLMVVLLLVFRSLLAAAMPLLLGGSVVAVARGALSLLAGVMQVDLFALSVVAMMGLALGVDYSLLVVSRFREEYDGGDPAAAARATARATARSVLPAGLALALAMAIPVLLLPGSIASSISLAVISVTILSMLSALCVAPALLTVLGDRLDRWSLPKREASGGRSLRWARRLSSHPRAITSILLLLVFLAGWAFTLRSSVVSAALLPPGDSGRRQQEAVERGLGPGWIAPIEIIVDGRGRRITTQRRLREIASFQRRIERDPGVQTMAGLAQLEAGARHLRGAESELAAGERGLAQLESGISRLGHGAELNTGGLLKAAEGSNALESGIGVASAGAEALAGGLQKTSDGSQQLSAGLGRASDGSGKLAEGSEKASSGAGRLADALDQAQQKSEGVTASAALFKSAMRTGDDRLGKLYSPLQGTEEQLASAWQALQRMTTGRADPEYAAALRAVEEASRRLTGTDLQTGEPTEPPFEGVEAGLEGAESQFGVGLYLASQLDKDGRQATEGMGKLADAARQLDRGIQRLASGSSGLAAGVSRLAQGGEVLSPALRQLGEGAGLLAGGLGRLQHGAGALAGGLGAGAEKS